MHQNQFTNVMFLVSAMTFPMLHFIGKSSDKIVEKKGAGTRPGTSLTNIILGLLYNSTMFP